MADSCEVFVVGALHLDVVVDAPRLPDIDETLVGSAVAYRFGGKGGNQAVMAARMGAKVAFAGAVGNDAAAETVLAALDTARVDRHLVTRETAATGMSVAILDKRGDYGAVIVSGANLLINPAEIATPRASKVLVLQNEVLAPVNDAALATSSSDCITILNAAPARAGAVPERTDIIVVNRGEGAALSGYPSSNTEGIAEELAKRARRAAILTLGPEGCILAVRDTPLVFMPAIPVDVRSTHGAGDAFVGAMAARLAIGKSLVESVRFALAAAAVTVATPPDDRTLLTPDQVQSFLNRSDV